MRVYALALLLSFGSFAVGDQLDQASREKPAAFAVKVDPKDESVTIYALSSVDKELLKRSKQDPKNEEIQASVANMFARIEKDFKPLKKHKFSSEEIASTAACYRPCWPIYYGCNWYRWGGCYNNLAFVNPFYNPGYFGYYGSSYSYSGGYYGNGMYYGGNGGMGYGNGGGYNYGGGMNPAWGIYGNM